MYGFSHRSRLIGRVFCLFHFFFSIQKRLCGNFIGDFHLITNFFVWQSKRYIYIFYHSFRYDSCVDCGSDACILSCAQLISSELSECRVAINSLDVEIYFECWLLSKVYRPLFARKKNSKCALNEIAWN